MNEHTKSKKKCLGNHKDTKEEDVSTMLVMDSKVHIENGASPKNSCDVRISGHSTPIRTKAHKKDIEDSPEIDYHCNSIFLSLTQDGGNEVAWDWQCSAGKSLDSFQENKSENVDTPKRNKLIQKKRNSNSPLLYKPLKRKLVKRQNMESIGKFAAELQAFNEKIRSIERNEKHKSEENNETNGTNSLLLVELDTKSNRVEDDIDNKTQKVPNNPENRLHESFEEFFDDSINDSMIKCSQEIEERLNLGVNKENTRQEDLNVEKSPTFSTKSTVILVNSSGGSMNSNVSENSLVFNVNNCSNTYSKMSLSDLGKNSDNSKAKQDSLKQSYFNNNISNIPKADRHKEKTDLKNSRDESSAFEIPDDSFDDCLASCPVGEVDTSPTGTEFDKIFSDYTASKYIKTYPSTSTKTNFVLKTPSFLNQSKVNVRQDNTVKSTHNSIQLFNNYSGCYQTSSDVNNVKLNSNSVAEERKFFKTKSLSDSYYTQGRKSIVNSKVNVINSDSNKTNEAVVNSNLKDIHKRNDIGNTHVLNLDRFNGKEDGDQIIRYNSLNNLNSARECTPEEIERKRLEAKMRLEAKRKLQANMNRVKR